MSFAGFSEEDLMRIKSGGASEDLKTINKKPTKFIPAKKTVYQYKTANLSNQKIDDAINDLQFENCRLSLRPIPVSKDETETKVESTNYEKGEITNAIIDYNDNENKNNSNSEKESKIHYHNVENNTIRENDISTEVNNVNITPDIVRGVDYVEDDLASHRAKLEDLQLKQKIMEEQNKKRKEMLSKALAHRTRQTEEEVVKLEKIKKELQVLDGQFSLDIGVLRKKIDLACLTYSDAEKHYLKVEKEFLHAKIQLQKEKEKKELLTEHLCALITHNETRKAQKLETLMLELAAHKNIELPNGVGNAPNSINETEDTVSSVIVDGVDQRTGKMVELNGDS